MTVLINIPLKAPMQMSEALSELIGKSEVCKLELVSVGFNLTQLQSVLGQSA